MTILEGALFGAGFLGAQCRGNVYKKLSGNYLHVNHSIIVTLFFFYI